MAEDIEELGRLAWRDWVIDGLISSGPHEPIKLDIRAFAAALEARLRMGWAYTVTSGTALDMDAAAYVSVDVVVINKTVSGVHEVILPPPGDVGRKIRIVDGKGDAGTYTITVTGAINGGTYATIAVNFGWIWVMDIGAGYIFIA